jgi:hypothetical protein
MFDDKRKWQTLEELAHGPARISWLNEPIDYSVDFEVVKETAEQRARRRWKMEERKESSK